MQIGYVENSKRRRFARCNLFCFHRSSSLCYPSNPMQASQQAEIMSQVVCQFKSVRANAEVFRITCSRRRFALGNAVKRSDCHILRPKKLPTWRAVQHTVLHRNSQLHRLKWRETCSSLANKHHARNMDNSPTTRQQTECS